MGSVHYCPYDAGPRHFGPKEERETLIGFHNQDLDPTPYLRILQEIDSTMGKSHVSF